MAHPDLATVLRGLEVTRRPGRYRFEKSDDPDRRLGATGLVTEPEGTTLIEPDDDGDWAWLTIAVETDLELVGLTAALAPALAQAGLPANILAGFHHDHILVPHDRVQLAMLTIEQLRQGIQPSPPAASPLATADVDALSVVAGLLPRLLVPEMGAVLTFLHEVGAAGCDDRQLLAAVPGTPRVVLALRAALIEAQLAEVHDGRTRLTPDRPPRYAAVLRQLAAGPLVVPRALAGYLDNGRIATYPKQLDDLTALLEHVVDVVGPGTVHSEASLTALLAAMGEPAELRRRLVDHGLVERTASGSRYVVRRRV